MQDLVELRDFFRSSSQDDNLILCTLVRKTGSSYRDVGAKKIVSLGGKTCGLLSGGCLEASIEKEARTRFAELPFITSFSTLSEDDRLLGYQTGCQGTIDILFEKMHADRLDLMIPFGSPKFAEGVAVSLEHATLGDRRFTSEKTEFYEPWIEPVQLYIVGCGADADAYIPLADSLGWDVHFLDYRRDLTFAERHPHANFTLAPVDQIAALVPNGARTAVVLMTHNYEADLEILRGLKNHRVGYLGCLGPAIRYTKLKTDMLRLYDETVSPEFDSLGHAPAGLFPHNRSPNEIALSVVAQIQAELIQQTHVWTLILAAGRSSRFDGVKALAPFQDQTLLERAQTTAQLFSSQNVMVVTGGHAETVASHINTNFIYNENWQAGMGTSIAKGISAIQTQDPKVDIVLILPVDQPLVSVEHLKALSEESLRSDRCALTANPEGVIGAPAALPKRLFAKVHELQGDRGLKSVLAISEMILLESATALHDVDQPADLERLLALT